MTEEIFGEEILLDENLGSKFIRKQNFFREQVLAQQIFLGTTFGKVIWEANILGMNFASKISFWEEKKDKYLGEEKIWGANFRENKIF